MAKKRRLTEDLRQILVNEYVDFNGTNEAFWAYIKEKDPRFVEYTDAQLRAYLSFADVYRPTNPRTPAKKKGKKKADWVAELEKLFEERGVVLMSAKNLVLADIQTLVEWLKNQ